MSPNFIVENLSELAEFLTLAYGLLNIRTECTLGKVYKVWQWSRPQDSAMSRQPCIFSFSHLGLSCIHVKPCVSASVDVPCF
jgi:hypothetical protein